MRMREIGASHLLRYVAATRDGRDEYWTAIDCGLFVAARISGGRVRLAGTAHFTDHEAAFADAARRADRSH